MPESPPPLARELDTLYRDPLHYDLLAQMTAPADLDFYLRLIAGRRGQLLELGCGTGRLTLPLAQRVDHATGVDRAPEMLALARSKAARQGIQVDFVDADFTTLALGRRFDWILLPYNALNHVVEADRIRALFETVVRHLAPDGRFVVDSFQPDPAALARPPCRNKLLTYLDPFSHERVVLYEENAYEPARQVNRVTWRYDVGDRPDARIDVTEMRMFFPQELDALFAYNGLRIEAKFGDYSGNPFGSRSPKQLVVASAA